MATLESTTDELINLFPKGYPKLDVVFRYNTGDELYAFFLQRNTLDDMRDWQAFLEFRGQLIKKDWPDTFDQLYCHCFKEIESKVIDIEDRVLLSIELYYLGDFEGNSMVELRYIRRNQGSSLKGIGAQFYQNLLQWLKARDYSFLVGYPVFQTKNFWRSVGPVPINELPPQQRRIVTRLKEPNELYVHCLDKI